MISKESEYLVHMAEEQLDRLNKALYLYEKNSEIESDILSSSLSLNHCNNFKCNSSNNAHLNRNAANFVPKNDLKPIFKLIRRQRDETVHGGSNCSKKIIKESEKKRPLIKSTSVYENTDHIRGWRTGASLVKQTLGPNSRSCHHSPMNKSRSVSPSIVKKKEKVSTFWDDKGNKRNPISPSKDRSNSERTMDNRCSKRHSDREEIQKYIKRKQKLAKEKRFETEMKNKLRKENIRSSLNNLQHYQDKQLYQYSKQKSTKNDNDCYFTKSHSMLSLQKPKLPNPIYDELEKDGLLEYIDLGNYGQPLTTSFSSKYKNGLNSTVDSGIDTGEWHQSITPERFRKSYDRMDNQKRSLHPPMVTLSKPTSQTDIRRDKKYASSKPKTQTKEAYQEQISAYDASSENDIVLDSDGKLSPSSAASSASAEFVLPNANYCLSRKKSELNITPNILQLNSKGSESSLKKKMSKSFPVGFDQEAACKSSLESINRDPSKMGYQIEALKEALFSAQMCLNSKNKEPDEIISEKISQAVQNFIKNKESNASTRAPSCLSPQSYGSPFPNMSYYTNNDSKSKILSKLDTSTLKSSFKKDPSTECEATEMEFENGKSLNINQDRELQESDQDLVKVPEENARDNLHEDLILKSFDVTEKIPNLKALKTDLLFRENRANEVIKLSKDLQKESKRVIQLEKRAYELSRKCIPGILLENKHQPNRESNTKEDDPHVSRLSKHLMFSDVVDKPNEQQRTVRMVNSQPFPPLDKVPESPRSNKSLQRESSQSENDEITISVSEITTTLTDQSELEARLLALQSEIEKKKQLVANLKKRQKDIKREKIKQKEMVLQKQIELYDNYINKLQISMDQLNSRMEESNSEDSHTLTGSTTNLHDLDQKGEHLDKEQSQDIQKDDVKKDQNKHSINIIEINNLPTDDASNTHLELRRNSLSSLVENNKIYETNEVDIDTILQDNYQKINENENDLLNNKIDLDSLIDVSLPNTVESKETKELFAGDNEDVFPSSVKEKSYDISVNLEIGGDCSKDVYMEENLIAFDKDDLSFNIDDLVHANLIDCDDTRDILSEQIGPEDFNNEKEDTDAILDSLLLMNKEPESLIDFDSIIITPSPIREPTDSKSYESKTETKKPKSETFDNVEEIEKDDRNTVHSSVDSPRIIKEDDRNTVPSPVDSPRILKKGINSDLDDNSETSSVKSDNFVKNIPKNEENDIENVFFESHLISGEHVESRIQYAETISDDRSSISDIDSINNFIEEDSLDDPKIRKLSPRMIENDLESPEYVLEVTPSVQLCPTIDAKSDESEKPVENVSKNQLPTESLHSAKIEEFVDNLFNTIMLKEIENLKPVLAEMKKEKPKKLNCVTVIDYQSTSFVDDDLEIMSPVTDNKAFTNNVLKSEDIWDFSDLTIEDPWKIENAFSIMVGEEESKLQPGPPEVEFDRKLFLEKISWLIPLKSEYIDPLIESAFKYLYEYRKENSYLPEHILSDTPNNLPHLFTNIEPIVTESEIMSELFDTQTQTQQPYIDKRIIFKIVLEAILEIYSFEKYLPQPAWIHSSFMVKKNVHSLWKGDTPPESYDLVRKIIREHLSVLLNQKNISLPDGNTKSQEYDSQSKLIKWCIRQQKDDVDKLLINDLRKEENEWIYYDEAEEEVKFQAAEDIFNALILDTVSWLQSTSDHNGNC